MRQTRSTRILITIVTINNKELLTEENLNDYQIAVMLVK